MTRRPILGCLLPLAALLSLALPVTPAHADPGDAWWDVATFEYGLAKHDIPLPDGFYDGYGQRPDQALHQLRLLVLALRETELSLRVLRQLPLPFLHAFL